MGFTIPPALQGSLVLTVPPCGVHYSPHPPGFTGIDSAYEPPENPDLVLQAGEWTVEECVQKVVQLLQDKVCTLTHFLVHEREREFCCS